MIPENRKISSTEENKADFLDSLNEALDVAEHISDALPETTTQEVQAIRREDGSSSAHPLDVDAPLDVDRNNSMSFEECSRHGRRLFKITFQKPFQDLLKD